jgi:hypothetical protein
MERATIAMLVDVGIFVRWDFLQLQVFCSADLMFHEMSVQNCFVDWLRLLL